MANKEDGSGKQNSGGLSKIREFFNSWKSNTLGKQTVSLDRTELLPRIKTSFDSSSDDNDSVDISDDEYGADSPFMPPDVPRGHMPVLVGFSDEGTLERFVIPCKFLSLPPFQVMLKKAEEYYGYNPDGMVTLPVEPATFKYILQCSLAQHLDMPEKPRNNDDSDSGDDKCSLGDEEEESFNKE